MFLHSLRYYFLFFVLCFPSSSSFAKMYKWVDDQGQTHYSQQAPKDRESDIIKAPPPPTVNPNIAQKKIDTLIEQQQGIYEEREDERRLEEEARISSENKEKYCEVNNHNLMEYINNPGRRLLDEDGNAIRPTEEQRQAKIEEIKQRLTEHCL